jgi:hypothetical protein
MILELSACSKFGKFKKKTTETVATEVVEEVEETAGSEGSEMAPMEPVQVQPTDSLFLSYERTPCHGRCPIFKIRLYQSGYVTYEGINFVDYMGYYQSRIGDQAMNRLTKQIDEVQYFNFEDRYDDERLMDLPSTIFVVNHEGQKKRVIARYQAPETLIGFGLFIEQEFKGTDWKPVTHDH